MTTAQEEAGQPTHERQGWQECGGGQDEVSRMHRSAPHRRGAAWDTEEAAEAATQAAAERLRQAVAALGREPEIQTFEIDEPLRRQRWGAV